MSYFAFDQDDSLSKFKRNRRKKTNPYHTPSNTGAGIGTSHSYRLNSTGLGLGDSSSSISIDDTEDASASGSLTYSASSSQAGESTDSSLADLGVLLEKEHQHHLTPQQRAKYSGGNSGRYLQREKSAKSAVDSLGYSDDEDADESVNLPSSWNHTISGQPSDSYAHDGGSAFSKTGPSPKKFPGSSPVSATADLNSCSAGSNGTPNTPPPRHSARKMMTHDEVWYQKWWMCGFTDALNLNPKG